VHILVKSLSITFHEEPCIRSQVVICKRIYRHGEDNDGIFRYKLAKKKYVESEEFCDAETKLLKR
jgi:hypothetical protein